MSDQSNEPPFSMEQSLGLAGLIEQLTEIVDDMDMDIVFYLREKLEKDISTEEAGGQIIAPHHFESRLMAKRQALKRIKAIIMFREAIDEKADSVKQHLREVNEDHMRESALGGFL